LGSTGGKKENHENATQKRNLCQKSQLRGGRRKSTNREATRGEKIASERASKKRGDAGGRGRGGGMVWDCGGEKKLP